MYCCTHALGNLHVIICILYKASVPDRPPTARLVRHLAATLLTWCITDRTSVITRDWQTGEVTFRRKDWVERERQRDREIDIYRGSGQIKQYNHNSWWYEPFKAVCYAARPVKHTAMRSASACWPFYYLLICLLLWLCINTPLSHGATCAGNELWCVCSLALHRCLLAI